MKSTRSVTLRSINRFLSVWLVYECHIPNPILPHFQGNAVVLFVVTRFSKSADSFLLSNLATEIKTTLNNNEGIVQNPYYSSRYCLRLVIVGH